jgi:hypothetical protein
MNERRTLTRRGSTESMTNPHALGKKLNTIISFMKNARVQQRKKGD